MQNAFLVRPAAFTSISATAETTAGPASNLANERMGRVWAPGTGSASVTVNFLNQEIDTIALLATNASGAMTWNDNVSGLGSTTLWASPEATNAVHRNGIRHFDPVTVSSVTVSVSGGASDFAAGRLVIGKSFKPEDNINAGYEIDIFDKGGSEIMPTGVEDDQILSKHLRISGEWGWVTEEEARGQMLKLLAYAGSSRPALVCVDYDATDRHNLLAYGLITDAGRIRHLGVNGYGVGFEVRSRLILTL